MTTTNEETAIDQTLAARLTRVALACGYVQKDAANAFHKYRYASAAAVLAHVNTALAENGVAVLSTSPSIVSADGAGKERVVTVRMEVVVGCATDPARATFVGLGSGMDAGDKAVMKATTAALKYAWMGALNISTGDDPEADEDTDRRQNARGRSEGAKTRTTETRRAAPEVETREADPPVDATNGQPVLGGFYARLTEIELPGEAVTVWMKFRAELAPLPLAEREAAWRALCARTEEVGRMKNARLWLKKAIQEEDTRRGLVDGAESQAA
jgi:hypothetical protein